MSVSTTYESLISVSRISQIANNCFTSGMDMHEIRRENLLELKGGMTLEALAVKIGTNAAYLSQILSPNMKGEIGSRLARRTEKAFERERGWLDHLHRKELSRYAISVGEVLDRQGLSPDEQERLASHLVNHIFALRGLMFDRRKPSSSTEPYPGDRRLNPFRPHSLGDTITFPKVDDLGPPSAGSKPPLKPTPRGSAGKRKK